MTDYYVPTSQTVTLPNGRPHRLVRGIHPVPDALVNHASANTFGIKPVEEMTDLEWRNIGLKKPVAVRAAPAPAEAPPIPATPAPIVDAAVVDQTPAVAPTVSSDTAPKA